MQLFFSLFCFVFPWGFKKKLLRVKGKKIEIRKAIFDESSNYCRIILLIQTETEKISTRVQFSFFKSLQNKILNVHLVFLPP